MQKTDAHFWEDVFSEPLRFSFCRFRLQSVYFRRVRLLDAWANHVHLPAFFYLVAHRAVGLFPLLGLNDRGRYFCASGRQLVEDGEVEVAVEGQSERARNG